MWSPETLVGVSPVEPRSHTGDWMVGVSSYTPGRMKTVSTPVAKADWMVGTSSGTVTVVARATTVPNGRASRIVQLAATQAPERPDEVMSFSVGRWPTRQSAWDRVGREPTDGCSYCTTCGSTA